MNGWHIERIAEKIRTFLDLYVFVFTIDLWQFKSYPFSFILSDDPAL